MAVDSESKRFSMLKFGSPWGVHVLPFDPNNSGMDGVDRFTALHLYGGNAPVAAGPPVANADSADAVCEVPKVISVLANDVADPPAEFGASAVSITVAPNDGTAVANADNTITYTADAGFSGTDTFTYQVTDSEGNTDTAVVTVTVTCEPKKGGPPSRGKGEGARRRIMVDGVVYRVRNRAEERMLLDKYIEQQRQQLQTAETVYEPTIKAKIRRAERRREKVIDGEAVEAEERLQQLQREDEEILLLLLH